MEGVGPGGGPNKCWKEVVEKDQTTTKQLEMWANAQRDGRPAEYTFNVCSMPQNLADAHYYNAVQ